MGQPSGRGHLLDIIFRRLRAITAFPKLPELLKTVRELKKKIDQLERK